MGVFNRTLSHFGLNVPILELVEAYRSHTPNIEMFVGIKDILLELNKYFNLIVITDGLAAVQKK